MGAYEEVFDLPDQPRAPGLARSIVRERCGSRVSGAVMESITLCVSELVTNAIDHAAPPYRLHVMCDDGCVRVAVDDGSVRTPVVLNQSPRDERGRGMYLVEQLAPRWGVREVADGKSVWVEFSEFSE